jgi:hypothetical protein
MTPAARLAALLAELPDDAMLPVQWVRAQLAAEGPASVAADTLPHDLSVKEFGAVFGRSASTARLWCEEGKIPGAWQLNGRTWRIPPASVDLFRESQRAGTSAPAIPPRPTTGRLDDWRNRQRKAAS